MENNVFTERLTEFGLTRQEACIYECLLMEGKTTGYEVAKQIGISRSNAYASLGQYDGEGGGLSGGRRQHKEICAGSAGRVLPQQHPRPGRIAARMADPKHKPDRESPMWKDILPSRETDHILNKMKNLLEHGGRQGLHFLHQELPASSCGRAGSTDRHKKEAGDRYGPAGQS